MTLEVHNSPTIDLKKVILDLKNIAEKYFYFFFFFRQFERYLKNIM